MAHTKLTSMLALESHAYLCRDGGRRRVTRHDQANEALQAQLVPGVLDYSASCLGSKTLTPARLVDQIGQLYFVLSIDGPRQEAASAQERTAASLDRGPKP